MRYAVIGHGKMGRAVDEAATLRGHARTAAIDLADAPLEAPALEGAEIAFEFTAPDAAEDHVGLLVDAGISVVCGTTGWSPSPDLHARALETGAALMVAPNFSIGVHLFFRLAAHAARAFGSLGLHEPFIHEAHHRGKIDAPSGTARRLASIVVEADPRLEKILEGHPEGRLAPGALQVVSTRAGAEPGTHRVGFDGPHDLVTLEHRARGREGFAFGAVLAAEWLQGQCGRFEFEAVLDAILSGELSARGGAG